MKKYGYSYFEVDEDNIVWQTDDYEPVRGRTNEPGQAVAKGKGIMKERPGSARGATPAPGTSGPAGQPVSFVPPQTPPKFYIKPEAPPIIGAQGLTAWYTSQSPNDIDVPIGRWVWVWKVLETGRMGWQGVDLDGDTIIHPTIPDEDCV
ncbi:hypothetical protein BDP27DRAFT_1425959 [Rhodocollybia butyracea]|uniref:Uncharacterized protein n=1 Tax=Rhodocollybia butyracea TaxID=206335 RepID=A0A9P5U270_9AGAR|nr:hypothetical protein BDP27DRAFT_1425959 [Rhodocollybia butyracea]